MYKKAIFDTEKKIQKAITKINALEAKRYSLPEVELTEMEINILQAIAEGRNKTEIDEALSYYQINPYVKISYCRTITILQNKFDALNLSNTIYKATKMGIVK